MISPTDWSPAEIGPRNDLLLGLDLLGQLRECSATAATAASIPRFRARVRTGGHVCADLAAPAPGARTSPSSAVTGTSSVFFATSLTISRRSSRNGSSSSISLAMLTPSFVMVGAPTSSRADIAALGAERHLYARRRGHSFPLEAAARLFVERDILAIRRCPPDRFAAARIARPPPRFHLFGRGGKPATTGRRAPAQTDDRWP